MLFQQAGKVVAYIVRGKRMTISPFQNVVIFMVFASEQPPIGFLLLLERSQEFTNAGEKRKTIRGCPPASRRNLKFFLKRKIPLRRQAAGGS